MFLRSSVVKKGGKTYRYWKLVEIRTYNGPRKQVVAHLGDLSNFSATEWQVLAGRVGEPETAAALERRVR